MAPNLLPLHPLPMLPGERDIRVVGTRQQLQDVVLTQHRIGAFVACTVPVPVAPGSPRHHMILRVREPAQPRNRRPACRRTGLIIAAVTVAAIAALALLTWVAYLIVTAIVAALPYLIGALVITAVVGAGLSASGRHCPGCPD